jgi:sulfur carrier protein
MEADVRLIVNGAPREVAGVLDVGRLVAELTPAVRGVAVAVNGEVVPRSGWADRTLHDGDRVEVLTAAQGG